MTCQWTYNYLMNSNNAFPLEGPAMLMGVLSPHNVVIPHNGLMYFD